jgi:hypothetical protein
VPTVTVDVAVPVVTARRRGTPATAIQETAAHNGPVLHTVLNVVQPDEWLYGWIRQLLY